jgi:hypothetical protein
MISQEQALRADAITLNSLSVSELVPLLADDFRYSSQAVVSEIESRHAFADYISTKLEAIQKSGVRVWAEMGQI